MYHGVDITNVDSIRFNMTTSGAGGLLEVRVSSATGNILASQVIKPEAGGAGFRGFADPVRFR